MSGNGTLTEKFGAVTISVETRDVVRAMARQALDQDEPIFIGTSPRARAPSIGEFWEAEGGIYCGRLVDENDRVYALVVARRHEGEFDKMPWQSAALKAAALDLHDHTDWALPNRMEALAMFQRLHPVVKDTDEAFATDYVYWTSAQHASDSDGAWCQGFDDGSQDYGRKDDSYRARAVRRVVLSN